MYIDARIFEAQPTFQQARLLSPVQAKTAGSCVHFYYHAFGKDIGVLNVYRKILTDSNDDLGIPIYTVNGNIGNQ